jgi:uncharacterized protein (DUF362 family)
MGVHMDNKVYVYQQVPDYSVISDNNKEISGFLMKELKTELIKRGDKVVIKPNFVKESHLYKPDDWEYIITHSEIIKMVLKNVIEALDNSGEIYIIDAPQTDSDYEKIIKRVNLPGIVEEFRKTTKIKIEYYDLREERWYYKQGIIVKRKKLAGDPKGYVKVNLGPYSEFCSKLNKDYYGADYDTNETKKYHNEKDNIYIISKSILDCNVFINLPKLKTHKLGGITASLKNLVGTCVIKNSIPHHTLGSPENGGDKFEHSTSKNNTESKLKSNALKILKTKNPLINYPFIVVKKIAGLFFGSPQSETIRNGSWHGNDTIWRATLDLNRILQYTDLNGNMCNTLQRKYFTLIDGIIGGEGKGPMEPDPKKSGILIAGFNPVYADTVAATLMGYDYKKIPTIANGYNINKYLLTSLKADDIIIKSNNILWQKKVSDFRYEDTLKFKPHFGWRGYIEL